MTDTLEPVQGIEEAQEQRGNNILLPLLVKIKSPNNIPKLLYYVYFPNRVFTIYP